MSSAKSNPQLVLRPQDLVVLMRLSVSNGVPPSYAALASELGMTASIKSSFLDAKDAKTNAKVAKQEDGLSLSLRPLRPDPLHPPPLQIRWGDGHPIGHPGAYQQPVQADCEPHAPGLLHG